MQKKREKRKKQKIVSLNFFIFLFYLAYVLGRKRSFCLHFLKKFLKK